MTPHTRPMPMRHVVGEVPLVNAVVHVIRADQELARSEPLVAGPAAGFLVPDEED